jgi:hypothetical protein
MMMSVPLNGDTEETFREKIRQQVAYRFNLRLSKDFCYFNRNKTKTQWCDLRKVKLGGTIIVGLP